jgi:glycosyltransferase involved in cell wall biosynthesis
MGHEQERRALERAALAVYPSEWAAASARERYGIAAERVHVLPFGPSVEPPDPRLVRRWIAERSSSELRILFVGREWRRKGGDLVLATCERLERAGVPVRLDIVGARPPGPLPCYARDHGKVDKRFPEGRAAIGALFARAHMLFVPSRAENFGLAYSEAAAHGVPSLARDVGGVASAVTDGVSGHVLPPAAPAEAYADLLASYFERPERLRALSLSSLDEAQGRLSWASFVERLLELVQAANLVR